MDLESFGWTAGGIVHVDGAKLNEARQLSQKISQFMHVEPLANPADNNNREGGEVSPSLTYLTTSTHTNIFFDSYRSHMSYCRIFSSSAVPRGHISVSRLCRWHTELSIHERVWYIPPTHPSHAHLKTHFNRSVSMPAPHTLPIMRFAKVTLRPVVWWGKSKESTAANRVIISEALKFLDAPDLAQAVKNGFLRWVTSKVGRDGHPRVPLLNNSIVELTIDDDLGTSLDVSVRFDAIDETNEASDASLCIFYPSTFLFPMHM